MTTCRGAVLMKGILRREVTIATTARKLLATHLVGRTVIGVLIEGSERLEPAITWRAVIHPGGLARTTFVFGMFREAMSMEGVESEDS